MRFPKKLEIIFVHVDFVCTLLFSLVIFRISTFAVRFGGIYLLGSLSRCIDVHLCALSNSWALSTFYVFFFIRVASVG